MIEKNFSRTAPKVPGFAAAPMSVVAPAIGSGNARLRRSEPVVIGVKPGVGLTGGAGALHMGVEPSARKGAAARCTALRAAIEQGDREAARAILRIDHGKHETRRLLAMAFGQSK